MKFFESHSECFLRCALQSLLPALMLAACGGTVPAPNGTTGAVTKTAATPCAATSDCAGAVCDTVSHTCLGCVQDPDCSAGQICLEGQCKVGKTCTSSVACKATAQVCDAVAGHCVDCVAGTDCADGKTCVANKCVFKTVCSSDVQCSTVCAVDLGVCVTCNKSADCSAGHWCGADHGCHAAVCQAGVCLGSPASSGMWFACNPDGSGYAAPKICDDGKACTVDSCAPASGCANVAQPGVDCSEPAKCAVDSKTDGQETDVDCGGAVCPHCASGAKCLVALDCLSQSCLSGVCSGDPGCVDGKKSGNETDTDCGGGSCKPCATGEKCVAGPDCGSLVCLNAMCAAATCNDQMKNGQEAAIDCGGGNCPACLPGQSCLVGSDCASALCKNGVCQPASCTDQTLNGTETDIDCGGAACPKCAEGKGCKLPDDCAFSGNACSVVACASGKCGTAAKNCDDGNACTADSCSAVTGCAHSVINSCDDGNACTTGDTCQSGTCVGATLSCKDAFPCTTDTCDASTGCVHTPTNSACDDGVACTTDACNTGTGCSHVPVNSACDDGVACSTDTCNTGTGCGHVDNGTTCNDGNSCTADVCNSGGSGTGCTHTPAAGSVCGNGKVCDATATCVTSGPPPAGMVLIPAGTFWMGCNASKDTNCNSDENPQHKVTLSAYYIDVTETTVTQYKACVDAGGCTAAGIAGSYGKNPNATYPNYSNNPVNYVTWTQSQQYCKWRGAGFDLPTEAQWEMAARGSCEKNGSTAGDPTCAAAMRTYPWGETTATCSYAVMWNGKYGCGTGATWAVGSIPAGDSPYGLHDMTGNVTEWTRDWYNPTYYSSSPVMDPYESVGVSFRVFRGGSFYSESTPVRHRYGYTPSHAENTIGLRCVRSFP